MTREQELMQEVASLRERLSRLSAASLRINESLELTTVLQGVLDSARALTGAAYGVVRVLGAQGDVEHILASGADEEQARALWALPGAADIVGRIGDAPEALRIGDFRSRLREWGIPEQPWPFPVSFAPAFLGAPIRHRGETVGNFYLGEKQGGAEFTPQDEETLVTFASEAALVIINARRYRDEQRARADLETLVQTAPVGVAVLDAKTREIVSVNREAQRIGGALIADRDNAGDPWESVTVRRASGREMSFSEGRRELFDRGDTLRSEEVVVTFPDGRTLNVLINATPIPGPGGDIESFVITMQDLAPLKDLERLRAEFLAMVSHELRTPLTSIKGSVTTLRGAAADLDPAEAGQFFRIIDEQSDHMGHLISDLLDVARIETGTLPVAPEPIELRTLLEESRTRFASAMREHDLHIDLPDDLPRVMADRRRIVQVVTNLLSNASQYSPDGAAIRVTAARDGVHLAVSVIDRGTGLPEERLPDLFRKFARIAADSQDHHPDSTGLGLAICKGIVEAHGGRIWAESAGPGLGTRFTFTIPVADDASPPQVRIPGTTSDEPDHRPILVVDDDPETLRYVRDVLSKAGYAPVVTGDPDDVPRLLEEVEPHLVLLDLILPGSDGIALMERILSTHDVPVIFLSVYGRDQTIAEAFERGASDYVVKPFSATELVARIRAAMRRNVLPEQPDPGQPYVRGELRIDYAARAVHVAGRPVELTDIEYRVLRELSLNAGVVLTYDHLMYRVWNRRPSSDRRPIRTVLRNLRRKLGDDADAPAYIFTRPRVGYRMPEGE